MQRHKLSAELRKIEGRKVKQLRKDGILPANVYGREFKSLSVQLPTKDFLKIYKEAGETGVVDLTVGENESLSVLIHNVQLHPVTGLPLHADFHKISLKEKVKAMVPVVMVGEAPAVTQKLGLLLTPLNEVEVEALPTDLPENIEIDIKTLTEVGSEIKLKDVKISEKVTLLSDPELVAAKIGDLITEEAKKEMEEEKAAAQAASAAAVAEAAPVEDGEAPKETSKEPASAEAMAGKEKAPEEQK